MSEQKSRVSVSFGNVSQTAASPQGSSSANVVKVFAASTTTGNGASNITLAQVQASSVITCAPTASIVKTLDSAAIFSAALLSVGSSYDFNLLNTNTNTGFRREGEISQTLPILTC